MDPSLQIAARSKALFEAIGRREKLTRLIYPRRITRHEKLMTWAIAQGAIQQPEACIYPVLAQNLAKAMADDLSSTGLTVDRITALRQQALGLSLVLPVIYRGIRKHDDAWTEHFIQADAQSLENLAHIKQQGALVLTAHTFFHNLLGAVLGLRGCKVDGVAAPLGLGPDWSIMRPILTAINWGSQSHFGGGQYLYTDNPRLLARGLESAKASKHVVVGLLDHGWPEAKTSYNVLGWQFGLQDSLVARWARSNQPIAFASLSPTVCQDKTKLLPRWQLNIQIIKAAEDQQANETILGHYAQRLTEFAMSEPWAWQGLRWAHAFPRSQS